MTICVVEFFCKMRYYKTVLLFKSDVKKEKREKFLQDIKKWIVDFKEKKIEEYGERKLAYPIRNERSGSYWVLEFEAPNIPKDLDKKILMNDDILRHLLVRTK